VRARGGGGGGGGGGGERGAGWGGGGGEQRTHHQTFFLHYKNLNSYPDCDKVTPTPNKVDVFETGITLPGRAALSKQ